MTTTTERIDINNATIHLSSMELHRHIDRLQESILRNTSPLSSFESEMVHHYIGHSKSMIERINLLVKHRNNMLGSDSDNGVD